MENAVLALREDRTGELTLLYFRGPTCQMFNTTPSFRRICCATRDCIMDYLRRGNNLSIDGLSFTSDNEAFVYAKSRIFKRCTVCLQRADIEISLQRLVISFEQSQLIVACAEAKVSCFDTELSILQRGVPSCFSIAFSNSDQAWEVFYTMRFARFMVSAAGRHYNWIDDEETVLAKDDTFLQPSKKQADALSTPDKQVYDRYLLNVGSRQLESSDQQDRIPSQQLGKLEMGNFAEADADTEYKAPDAEIKPIESPQAYLWDMCEAAAPYVYHDLIAASPTPLAAVDNADLPTEYLTSEANTAEALDGAIQCDNFQPIYQQPDEQACYLAVGAASEAKPVVFGEETSQPPTYKDRAGGMYATQEPAIAPNLAQEKEKGDFAAYRNKYLKAELLSAVYATAQEPNSPALLLKTPPYMADQTLSYLTRAREFVRYSPEYLRDIELHIERLYRENPRRETYTAPRNFERVVPAVKTMRNDFWLSNAALRASSTCDAAIAQQSHSQVYSALSMIAAQAQNATEHFCEAAAPISLANSALLYRQHEDFYGHFADEAKRYVAELESDRDVRLRFSPQTMKGVQYSSVLATEIPAEAPRRTSNCRVSSDQQTADINVSAINSAGQTSVLHELSEEDPRTCQKSKRKWWTRREPRK